MDYRALVQKLGDRTNQNTQTSELILEHRTGHPIKQWTFQFQATDVFRTARNSMFTYGTSMLLDKWNYSDSQAVKLTISYRFNSVNSKYKGTGAGNEEKSRL